MSIQKHAKRVALALIVMIVALPQVTETIYTPSLPDVARCFFVECHMAESTLTIYLFGFAVGVAVWGNLSDLYGRKSILMLGIGLYILASFFCYVSGTIEALLASRFLQAFGGSTGSVLGQAIARDSFAPSERSKAFSSISMALAFSPALGPTIGGHLDKFYGWQSVFIFLILLGGVTLTWVWRSLPETHGGGSPQPKGSFIERLKDILTDRRVMGFAFLVGSSNGIIFSYYAEGPFYFIDMLNMTPDVYGMMSIGVAAPLLLGAYTSKILNQKGIKGEKIIMMGATFNFIFTLMFTVLAQSEVISHRDPMSAIIISYSLVMIPAFGHALIIPNCLGLALQKYGTNAGQAASVFGCVYYLLISGFTLLMGYFHNGTLKAMPTYFLALNIANLLVIWWSFIRKAHTRAFKA
ncbi:multidrug effflux MFS transporter [Candidatus Nucleicultrix amoebiphila]|jgi:Bcr/CflA subfamily drug resistance transporter|uniref:Bcr/CflA family efflux transporter n=1 Tax=Candidatus Nucleicultrix amoebiphila FS5 TaxID=1414854 RepID=A0A1W6N6P1_9PROT|nr:multidrug effflux MFS transporter [Candidatus Nucleicultrix amoebiphila]ARN85416.1 hypothetical protein GQ61_09105 [Candidatus Nucleicultrix amoebiphila FS5]